MIVQYLLAIACILFVVSLPLARTPIGGILRRWAAACFLLALAPALFIGLLRHVIRGTASSPHSIGTTIGGVVALVFLCVVAYAILEIRAKLRRPKQDAWSEYINMRSTGKVVVKDRNKQAGMPPVTPPDPGGP